MPPSFISSSFFLRCIKLSEEVERNCCFPASTIPILNQVKNLFYSYLAYIISKIDAADFFSQYKFLITTFGSLEDLGLESSAKITEITPPPIHDLSPSHYREPRSLSLSLSRRFLIRSRSIPRRDNAWIDAACYRSAVKHVPWRCGQGEHGHKREELEVSPRMERRDGRTVHNGWRKDVDSLSGRLAERYRLSILSRLGKG